MRPWLETQEKEISAEPLQLAGGQRLVAQALLRRGYVDPAAARAFLDPAYYSPASPYELPGMDRAVERLQVALRRKEHILVWGDFDVDGQTATTLLVATLRELGGRVSYHIPVRAQESHGVNLPVLQSLLEESDPPAVVLTCDTGISAQPAAEYAREQQVDLIITDHHELPRRLSGDTGIKDEGSGRESGEMTCLPPAYAVVTPRLLPAGHSLGSLPGVGVAYKLAQALYQAAGNPTGVEQHLDLAALGIVADVALLTGEARYLLQRGLERLRQPQRAGLLAIYERAGLSAGRLTEEQIGFVLAPRLNALGRLGDANPAVELLSTQDQGRARLLALQLEGLNSRRQLLTSQVLRSALAQIEQDPTLNEGQALVLAHPSWPAGVIGIVASRLVELLGKPCALIASPPGEDGRGSARSVEGIDISAAISTQARLLNGFGGHVMAAGFAIPAENIARFRAGLSQTVAKQWEALPPERAAGQSALAIDGYLPWSETGLELAESLERLAPYGAGNPPLALVSRGLHLVHQAAFGRQGEHLHLTLEDQDGFSQRVTWWGAGDLDPSKTVPNTLFDLAYTLRATTYRGKQELQVTWLDARGAPQAAGLLKAPAAPELVDYRRQDQPLPILLRLLTDTEVGKIQVWAEAEAYSRLRQSWGDAIRDRTQLAQCEQLVIWTIPPGSNELASAISHTKPKQVIVFLSDPAMDLPQPFLERLAGLVKHALAKRNGWISYLQLACATAQQVWLVQLGIEWLAAKGNLSIIKNDDDMDVSDSPGGELNRVQVAAGGKIDPAQAAALLEQIQNSLDETRAFRAYFSHHDPLALDV
jgi:single-stranded-DNA-specific exonuclease